MLQSKGVIIGLASAAVILFIVVMVVIFSGGGGDKPTESKITIWTPIDSQETFDPIIRKFKKTNPDVEIRVEKKDLVSYEDEVINSIAAGKGPDIWMVRNDWFPKHVGKLSPMPIKVTKKENPLEDYKKRFINVVVEENIIDNKIYGLPLSADPLALFYNKKVITKAVESYRQTHSKDNSINWDTVLFSGPQTWDEFELMAKIANSKEGGQITRSGAALGLTSNVNNSTDILYLLMLQNGTNFRSSDGKTANFHLPTTSLTGTSIYPGTKALDFYTKFAVPTNEFYSWNSSMPNSLEAFTNERAAMIIDYASQQDYVKQVNPTLSFKVVPVPQIKGSLNQASYSRYWSFGVNRNSTNKALAWNFINFLDSDEISRMYLTATQRYSVYASAYKSGAKDTYPRNVNHQLRVAKSVYKLDADEFDKIMAQMIDNVVIGHNSAQNAIEKAASQVTSMLTR